MADFEIRRAASSDAECIARVHVASWRETYAGLLPKELLASLDVAARHNMWASQLSESLPALATMAFVLQRGDQIVGFGACGGQRSPELKAAGYDGEIYAIYFLKAARGFGAGRMLMQHMAFLLSEHGKSGIGLWVLAGNNEARRFYESLGGQFAGERKETRPE